MTPPTSLLQHFLYCKWELPFTQSLALPQKVFSEKVPPGFELVFDVYSCLLDSDFVPLENLAGMSGSMRFKRKLKGSLRRSIGSKLGSFVVRWFSYRIKDGANLRFFSEEKFGHCWKSVWPVWKSCHCHCTNVRSQHRNVKLWSSDFEPRYIQVTSYFVLITWGWYCFRSRWATSVVRLFLSKNWGPANFCTQSSFWGATQN